MLTSATQKLRDLALSFFVIATLFSSALKAQTGTWGTITTLAPHTNAGVLLVLTDGSILCKTSSGGGNGTVWDRLTPVNGSYKNGTWTSIAAMHNDRLYFSSQVLPDGRVYVCGGEYGAGGSYGEVWDPKTNVWTVAGGPTWVFPNVVSDANSEILYDGKVLQASVDEAGVNWNYLWDPVTNTYVRGPNCLRIDNEGTWVKLPDSSIVFPDNYSTTSERYMPKTNTWINDGVSPVNLYDPYGSEAGGAFMLPDGRAFFIGSTPNTAYYTPTGTTAPGTWTAGPTIPGGYGATDAPAVIMPNGKILLTVSPAPTSANHFPSPTEYFEFDYLTNTFTQVGAPGGGLTTANACYIGNMVDLPDGTVLFANQGTNRYYQYTPGTGPLAAGQPTISGVNRVNCDTFQAVGTLFNGISEGSAYGDDWQEESNYPIIRLNDAAGNIVYTTTYNWNRIGAVMTGTLPDTCIFAIPATLAPGTYSVTVVANGNPSAPFRINTSLTITPSPVSLCTGTTVTLSDSSSIGVWSSANTGVASVGSVSGVVTGVGVGTTTITYSIGQCHASVSVSVNAGASPILGTLSVCVGGTTPLSDALTGGTWSSSNTNATVGSAGLVTGVAAGTSIISYVAPSGCVNSAIVTVNAATATITPVGSTSVCAPATVLLNANTGAGLTYQWQVGGSNIIGATTSSYIASVTGTYNVVVSSSPACTFTSLPVVVTVGPITLPITGSYTICANSTTQLTDATTGGTWLSSSPADASVGIGTGFITSGGDLITTTVTITYTAPSGCAVNAVLTVYPLPSAAITPAGSTIFCTGGSVVLNANTGAGLTYQWQLGGINITGATLSSYTATIGGSYTVVVYNPQGCSKTSTVVTVTVGTPTGATITASGPTTFCAGGSVALNANTGAGYTYQWQVGGVNIGGATTSTYTATLGGDYTVLVSSSGCNSTSAATTITITSGPGATITPAGPTTFCAGGSVVLNANTGVGMTYQWLSGGVNISGATSASYTATTSGNYAVIVSQGSCIATSATTTVTVINLPAVAAIVGATNVCIGQSVLLTDADAGGVWSSGTIATASVDALGNVTGAGTGTATISYTLSNACGATSVTYLMTVNSSTALLPITGGTNLCVGQTSALSESVAGGLWSSFNPAIATVSATGVATGIAVGTTGISYTLTNAAGCSSTAVATVDVAAVFTSSVTPASATTFCTGGYVGLNATTGTGYTYQWQAGGVNIPGATSSSYIANTSGNYAVVITNATGCPSTSGGVPVTVNPSPILVPSVSVTGDLGTVLCGSTAVENFAATPTNGGGSPTYQWYMNGVNSGAGATYTYSPATGDVVKVVMTSSDICAFPDTAINSLTMTISPVLTPSVSITSVHSDSTCTGDTVQFIAVPVYGGTAPTYLWTENGINVATGPYYVYTPQDGDTLVLTMTSNYPCLSTNLAVSNIFIVHVFPPVINSLSVSVSQSSIVSGSVDTFTAIASGAGAAPSFRWFIDGVTVPGATGFQYITDTLQDGQVVNCEETSSFVCSEPRTVVSGGISMSVVPSGIKTTVYNSGNFTLVPNPNNGEFTIKGKLKSVANQKVNIVVTNVLGQAVYKRTIQANSGLVNEQVTLDKSVAAGSYQVSVTSGEDHVVFHVVVEK